MGGTIVPSGVASGRELAYAESTVQQTGIGAASVDVTGLSITFTVGTRPVVVEAFLPWCIASADGDSFVVEIQDGAGTALTQGAFSSPGAGKADQLRATQRITTPGAYTRKAAVHRTGGAGTLTVNDAAGLPDTVAFIRAVEA
jgi:hypothetical protein